MKNTHIEWCDHTVNFWWGCTFARLSDGSIDPACIHCYAKTLSAFWSKGRATWGKDGERWLRFNAAFKELMQLDRSAGKRGVRERIFINSMSDVFEDRPDLDGARLMLWTACRLVTNLDLLLLTKRPENVTRMVPQDWIGTENWPGHVWIGTSTGTQQAYDERLPHLLSIPAKVRFLSVEPLLESINLRFARTEEGEVPGPFPFFPGDKEPSELIHWIIVGGESGDKARPMNTDWAADILEQCTDCYEERTPAFFMKQLGGVRDKRGDLESLPPELRVRQFPPTFNP